VSVDVDFLVEDLIESVKDRSFAPISQSTFEDADILRILNEEQLRVMAKIIKVREDFFYARQTTALTAGKDHYLIPKSASGNALKALFWVDSGGNKRMLTRRDIDRIGEYSTSRGESSSFYFEGDEVVLMNPPGSGDSLLFVFSRRPNRLVATSGCAKITAVSDAAGNCTFTVNTDLTASLTAGTSKVDFVRATSPFTIWSESVTVTSITATTIGVASTDIYDVDGSTVEPAATDYICPTGYTNIPMFPIEFHGVLAQRGACRILGSMGDLNKWNAAIAELKMLEQDALDVIKNRAESSPERPSKKSGLLKTFRSW
jgi:hypothetical protein